MFPLDRSEAVAVKGFGVAGRHIRDARGEDKVVRYWESATEAGN